MSLRSPLSGDVVQRSGASYAVAYVRDAVAILCPILTARDFRHRADVEIVFPDTMYLGLNDGAIIRCKPIAAKGLATEIVGASLSDAMLLRVRAAVAREMEARRIEDGRAKYLAY